MDRELLISRKDHKQQRNLIDTIDDGLFSKEDEKKLMRDFLQIKTEAKILSDKRSELERELNDKHITKISLVRECRELKAKIQLAKRATEKSGQEPVKEITETRIDELRERILAVESEKNKYEKFFEEDMSRMEMISLELKKESAQLEIAMKDYNWMHRQNQVKVKDYLRIKRYRDTISGSNSHKKDADGDDLMAVVMLEQKTELMKSEEKLANERQKKTETMDKQYQDKLKMEKLKITNEISTHKADKENASKQTLTKKDEISNLSSQKGNTSKLDDKSQIDNSMKIKDSHKIELDKSIKKASELDNFSQNKVTERSNKSEIKKEFAPVNDNKKSDIKVIDNSKAVEEIEKPGKDSKNNISVNMKSNVDANQSKAQASVDTKNDINGQNGTQLVKNLDEKLQLEKDKQLKMTSKTPTFSDPTKIPTSNNPPPKKPEAKDLSQTDQKSHNITPAQPQSINHNTKQQGLIDSRDPQDKPGKTSPPDNQASKAKLESPVKQTPAANHGLHHDDNNDRLDDSSLGEF